MDQLLTDEVGFLQRFGEGCRKDSRSVNRVAATVRTNGNDRRISVFPVCAPDVTSSAFAVNCACEQLDQGCSMC